MIPRRFQSRPAFSLVEMLVVIALIGMLLALSGPTLSGVLLGSQLSRGGQIVHDQLVLARQLALSRNSPIEVRFYRYTEPAAPEPREATAAVQLFEFRDDGTSVPATAARFLPAPVMIDDDAAYSNISGVLSLLPGEIPIPRAGTDYQYRRIFFLPDGSTDLAGYDFGGALPYLTIVRRTGGPEVPKDYYTIQIQPETGHISALRP